MPEGRAERAVEAPAKSIDGAEHSGMMRDMMAVVDRWPGSARTSCAMTVPGVGVIIVQIWLQNGTLIAPQIAANMPHRSAHHRRATSTSQ